jgi:hypothetical protein
MSNSPLARSLAAAIGTLTLGVAASVHAAQADVPAIDAAAARAAIAAHEAQAAAAHARAPAQRLVPAATGQSTASAAKAKDLTINPSRAYPPSCLADGLPVFTTGSDPNAQQGTLTLVGADASGNALSETDTFTVWRVPCSGNVSATLLEIDRPSTAASGSYVSFPNILLQSTSSGVQYFPRLPSDPNTVYSDTPPLGAIFSGNVYVLDYVFGNSPSDSPDFNQAFSLNIDNLASPDSNITLSIPTYNPATFNYPSVTNPLEISGYVSGPWYDPAHGGEGMLIEVYDINQTTRILSATWYTFDNLGLPFWLVAQATIPTLDTTAGVTNGFQVINAPVTFPTGGGFAGNFGASATSNHWGTMSMSFPNCNTLNFSYNGTTGSTVSNGPGGSGSRTWQRLAGINGVVCQ